MTKFWQDEFNCLRWEKKQLRETKLLLLRKSET